MNWKINKLNIENFKFFGQPFIFETDYKNVLLYGENGSGKSSIYWALYTLFQSCMKANDADIEKYFDAAHEQNLRNRFMADDAYSGINVEFKHTDGRTKSFEISTSRINTIGVADTLLPFTVVSSDFMNYKFLSSLFDFRNSAENDVFPLFYKEIFPFLNFTKGCKNWEGNESQSHTADTWWNMIKEWRNHLPVRKNAYIEGDEKYKTYQNLLLDFNKEIKDVLLKIEFSTNQKLRDLFHLPVTIKFETQAPRFNCLRDGYVKSKDGILHNPKILIRGEINYETLL